MADIEDLYEVNDREPDEPEPDEYDQQPVDLEEVEQRLERLKFLCPPFGLLPERVELGDAEVLQDLASLIGQDVLGMIADLREARERIAEFEALEKTGRWSVTASQDDRPGPFTYWYSSAADAETVAKEHGGQMWRQVTTARWEPIDPKAPF